MRKRGSCRAAVWVLPALMAGFLEAQTVTGSLVGHVSDTAEAAVAGARVVATEITRGAARETRTNEVGNYTLSSMDPGRYRLEIDQPGFRKFLADNVELNINTTVRVDARLQIGAVTESVEVVADAVQLKTDRGDLSAQIQHDQVENLPLSIDRNYQALFELVPGSTEPAASGSSFGNPGGSLVNNVNGQNIRANGYQLDGTLNNQTNVIAQSAIVPPAEAIQVVDISTNAYDAEQGRASGAAVNVSIKSGTNDLHGSLFAYDTNSALKARNSLSTVPKPVTNLMQAGFTLGGPIQRNRTFLFGDYQAGRNRTGQNTVADVPTAEFRRGDFSAAAQRVYDPLTGAANGSGRTQFPGNIVPAGRISQVARNLFAELPLPNRAGDVNNYETSGSARQNRNSFDVKVNHRFTDMTDGFVRYSYMGAETSDPPIFGSLGGPTSSGGGTAAVGPSRIQGASSNLTHVLTPTMVTEFRAGLVRVFITGEPVGDPLIAQKIGIPNSDIPGDFFARGMTRIQVPGYTTLGLAGSLPFKIAETSYNFVNNWTKQTGNHAVRWGADIRNQIMNKYQAGDTRGLMNFGRGITSTSGQTTGNANGVAALLLGLPDTMNRLIVQQLGGFRQRSYFLFVQDRWQATPRLTLNYGLRYEIMPFATAANPGDQSSYDPFTNKVMIAGYGPYNRQLNVNTDYHDFCPRAGVAWRAFSTTVVRAGYGISYNPLPVNQLSAANYPSQINAQWAGPNSFQPAGSLGAGFPTVPLIDVSSGLVVPPNNVALSVFNQDARRGYVQSYNFTIEQELGGWVIANSYVGSLGTRMLGSYNLNAAGPGSTLADRPLNRLYGRTADITYFDYMLSTAYHGYQLAARRRWQRVGVMTVSYTFSKSLDYADNWAINYDLNVDINRGPSNFDRRNNLVVSHVIALPFGKGHRLLSGGLGSKLLGGWRASGILGIRSGSTINVSGQRTTANATQGTANRPNVLSAPATLKGVGPGKTWFDTSVFVEPPPGTLGNVSRNFVRGPGYVNYSATLSRTFPITERLRLMFNIAAFNVTNTAHYSNPTGSFSSANFGRVTASFGERQVRLGARMEF